MNDPRLVRVGADGSEEVVDLRAFAGHLNDMVVTPEGLRTSMRTTTTSTGAHIAS